MEERFWIVDDVDESDGNANVTGWFGVVDEREGGIVAYAGTLERAQMIKQLLVDHPDYA